jgi:hypothetical protein
MDQLAPVQVVHLADLEAAEDRISVSLSLVEQAEFDGPHGRLHAVANSKLDADVPYVSLYRTHTDREVSGDLLVGLSLHH